MTDAPQIDAPPKPTMTTGKNVGLVVLGALAGSASGFFGIGGGVVMVGALTSAFRYNIRVAIACSLASVVPLAIIASSAHLISHPDSVDWRVVVVMALGSVLGSRTGVVVRARLPDFWLKKAFALLLIGAAAKIVIGAPEAAEALVQGWPWLVVVGMMAGLASSLFGIGGGIVMVPALALGWAVPMQPGAAEAATAAQAWWEVSATAAAIPISLATMVPTSLAGVFFQRKLRSVHAPTVVRLSIAGGLMTIIGAVALNSIDSPRAVEVAFSVLLALVAIRALVERRKPRAAPANAALDPSVEPRDSGTDTVESTGTDATTASDATTAASAPASTNPSPSR